jgi:hypothetical protein
MLVATCFRRISPGISFILEERDYNVDKLRKEEEEEENEER